LRRTRLRNLLNKARWIPMTELSHAALERIMRKAGAQRVSAPAVETMVEALEDYGERLSSEAVDLARHAGRKTIKREDVKLAAKRLGPL
jgi:histone H3/H4